MERKAKRRSLLKVVPAAAAAAVASQLRQLPDFFGLARADPRENSGWAPSPPPTADGEPYAGFLILPSGHAPAPGRVAPPNPSRIPQLENLTETSVRLEYRWASSAAQVASDTGVAVYGLESGAELAHAYSAWTAGLPYSVEISYRARDAETDTTHYCELSLALVYPDPMPIQAGGPEGSTEVRRCDDLLPRPAIIFQDAEGFTARWREDHGFFALQILDAPREDLIQRTIRQLVRCEP